MTSIKIKFRPSACNCKEGSLFYQVIHDRSVRQVSTGVGVFAYEWNYAVSRINVTAGISYERRQYLMAFQAKLDAGYQRLLHVVEYLEMQGMPYSVDNVVERFDDSGCDLVEFVEGIVSELRSQSRYRSAETYITALNSFMRYRSSRSMPLCDMDAAVILGYDRYLREKGLNINTVSFYMRNLRAIYNRAVDKGLVAQSNPFKRVYTGVARTTKRAIPIRDLRRIKNADLSAMPMLGYARDIFMFSFYTRGMSFVDIAYLQKQNLCNGVLTYCRRKTGQRMAIRWEREMRDIVNRYTVEDSRYMFPVITDNGRDARSQYKNASHAINQSLKKLGEMLSLPLPLTMYVARHAWASIARSNNVSVSVISEAMGHDSENTTRIYLAAIDAKTVDRVNSRIIRAL